MMNFVPEAPVSAVDISRLLVALGEAMIDAGDPVTHVQWSLSREAGVNGSSGTEVVVMATALFVSVPGLRQRPHGSRHGGRRIVAHRSGGGLFDLVEDGAIAPAEGIEMPASRWPRTCRRRPSSCRYRQFRWTSSRQEIR